MAAVTDPTATSAVPASTAADAPVPEAEAFLCPMCDYDLRGQVEPRCPECGYRFSWEELRDPSRRLHPYLFELHPERNLRSFLRTIAGGLLPRRFWRRMSPTQPASVRRLILYHVLVVVPALLAVIITVTATTTARIRWSREARAQAVAFYASPVGQQSLARQYASLGTPPPTTQQIIDQSAPLLSPMRVFADAFAELAEEPVMTAGVAVFAWPLLTLAAMMIFRISMRRARVKPVHAMRCVVYCADVMAWFNVCALLVAGLWATEAIGGVAIFRVLPPNWYFVTLFAVAILAALTFFYRLVIAIRLYLRFDHAWATALATQVIAALVATIILLLQYNSQFAF
jgi:hypothetical protein